MSTVEIKRCADRLRKSLSREHSVKLKAGHALQLIAAFLGYRSYEVLKSQKGLPGAILEDRAIFEPNLALVEIRRRKLKQLPSDLPSTCDLATMITTLLKNQGLFRRGVWLYGDLHADIAQLLRIHCDHLIMDEVVGHTTEINATFKEFPHYDSVEPLDNGGILKVTVGGELQNDKAFGVHITLARVAGTWCFLDLDVECAVNDEYCDPESRITHRRGLANRNVTLAGGRS